MKFDVEVAVAPHLKFGCDFYAIYIMLFRDLQQENRLDVEQTGRRLTWWLIQP